MTSNNLDFKFAAEIGPGRKQRFFSEQDDLYYWRQHMFEFANKICQHLMQNKSLKVLEVGPSNCLYTESFDQFDTSIIAKTCREHNIYYKTLDIDVQAKSDFIGSVEDLSFISEKFDVIIMLGIIEHVENIFVLSNSFDNATNNKATIFINSPFLFKVHGPLPDCWRLSEYAYNFLFHDKYDLKIETFPLNELGKNTMPLSFNVALTKK